MRRSEQSDEGRAHLVGGGEESGKDDSTLPPILRAPAHLIARVFSQLDCVDLLTCSLVCKQWYRDSAEIREGWKNEYLEAWTLYGLFIKRETHPPSSTCSIRVFNGQECKEKAKNKEVNCGGRKIKASL
ncbi:uncharacterized protein LOC109716928 isoform X3 [Ananas comosus]|uniref:Uncharacterized protein LOC109716928 isoform X3 n=1 Tax=Ananas comosus TaxID=4615 RepID=A0A199VM15_ANACO|nr:uncharacterized protein LOC109716928 isoform X3 [Ananas comosus]OAY77770.1 hypothetical protein ACMD2_07264 [Ananas comosus]